MDQYWNEKLRWHLLLLFHKMVQHFFVLCRKNQSSKVNKATAAGKSIMDEQWVLNQLELTSWSGASSGTSSAGSGAAHKSTSGSKAASSSVVADLGTVRNTGSGKNPDGSSSLTEEEENEKFEAIKRQMTEGQSGVDVLLRTINNEAMTDLTGTPMYMSPEQYRFTYSYPVDVYAFGLMMIRLFTLKLPYPIEVCTMKQLMDGGRAGVLVPTKVLQSDVPARIRKDIHPQYF